MASIKKEPIPEKFLSDHLFLLMGQNPLPNYVSALLLTPPDRTATVYLLHTAGADKSNTKPLAEQLKKLLEAQTQRQIEAELCEVKEADSVEIVTRVKSAIHAIQQQHDSPQVGLNYTGGTKPMCIHTHRTLTLQEHFPAAVCSYLDARDLALYFDGISTPRPINSNIKISLEELADLHGYRLTLGETEKSLPRVDLANALALVHRTDTGFVQWREYTTVIANQTAAITQTGRTDPITFDLPDPGRYPGLRPVWETIVALCDGEPTLEALVPELCFARPGQVLDWFKGKWLEEFALLAIVENAAEFGIESYGRGLKPHPNKSSKIEVKDQRNFDLDVAAMIGYQLFAVSCIVSQKSGGETKRHLMEAYTRARQLGGDEARIALVSCVQNTQALENEIKKDWHASDQIKVFGQHDLKRLPAVFRRWFKTNIP